jgi:hypothetical protein
MGFLDRFSWGLPRDPNARALAVSARLLELEWHENVDSETSAQWILAGLPGSSALHMRAWDGVCRIHILLRRTRTDVLDQAAQAINRLAFASRIVVLRDDGILSWRLHFRFHGELHESTCKSALRTFMNEVRTLSDSLILFGLEPARLPAPPSVEEVVESIGPGVLGELLEQLGGETFRQPFGLRWQTKGDVHHVLMIEGPTGRVEDLVLRTERAIGAPLTSEADRNAHLNVLNFRNPSVACAIDLARGVLVHRTYVPLGARFDEEAFLEAAGHHRDFWDDPVTREALDIFD